MKKYLTTVLFLMSMIVTMHGQEIPNENLQMQLPNNDGRAGMVTIVKHIEEIFDIDIVAEHLHKALPKFAMPIFIRLKDRINVTHTHKIKKFDLKKEGFDCDGKIYVMLPKSMTYVEMDKNLLNDINKGVYIF